MRSQSHGRLWPLLLKLKYGNGLFTSNCYGSSWKKFNSGFQFQFQFQGFQFQFHFQFHQFQFQFQFRNWNWNWAAIPIPELNWPQPCSQSKQSDPGSSSIQYDVISTFLCLILCCWHWGGCKLCVNMSSLCMNTCFGASHRNYGDRQQILVCFVLWVGVLGGTGRLGIPQCSC